MQNLSKYNFKKFFNAAAVLILFVLLILTSELIYTYRNRPGSLGKIGLSLAKIILRTKNLKLTIKLMDFSGSFLIKQNQIYFPGKIPDSKIKTSLGKVDRQTKEEIISILSETLPKAQTLAHTPSLSNLYYNTAIIQP